MYYTGIEAIFLRADANAPKRNSFNMLYYIS
jgi:hypothetical protein